MLTSCPECSKVYKSAERVPCPKCAWNGYKTLRRTVENMDEATEEIYHHKIDSVGH